MSTIKEFWKNKKTIIMIAIMYLGSVFFDKLDRVYYLGWLIALIAAKVAFGKNISKVVFAFNTVMAIAGLFGWLPYVEGAMLVIGGFLFNGLITLGVIYLIIKVMKRKSKDEGSTEDSEIA